MRKSIYNSRDLRDYKEQITSVNSSFIVGITESLVDSLLLICNDNSKIIVPSCVVLWASYKRSVASRQLNRF